MEGINGQSAAEGIAIGKILVYKNQQISVDEHKVDDPDKEFERFITARDKSVNELVKLKELADSKTGKESAEIFTMQKMLLLDPDFEDAVKDEIIGQHSNAVFAVKKAGKDLADFFSAMEDNEYMQQRCADFLDISDRIARVLENADCNLSTIDEPVILMADDLTPGETIQMDTTNVLAFVTGGGSVNSHTAILARSIGITAVVNTGVEADTKLNGHMGIVDGDMGRVLIVPEDEILEKYEEKLKKYNDEKKSLEELRTVSTVTRSGRKIDLYANVGNIQDVVRAVDSGADGIGLFRSEFLYIGKADFPSEEEQFESYKKAAELMNGKEVIIRTLDIGADKKADYLNLGKEENPAMGMRAIRICLKHPEIFKTQLRAIYRASAFGTISVMFPMITSAHEVERALQITDDVKKELSDKSIRYGEVKRGIMIETPAAAVMSDILAEKVDFFSIGTNDLTQYTLAMDRQNPEMSEFLDMHSPAVLRLIKMTVRNAHEKNVKVGICGELGADPKLTEFFINNEVDELSVSAPKILSLRKHIRELE